MADKPNYADEPDEINWLEHWDLPITFPDPKSKDAYKGLIRIYINTWLSLYNTFRSESTQYEIKSIKERPGGENGFFLDIKLHPPVQKRIPTDDDAIQHLTPPPPPPPPDDSLGLKRSKLSVDRIQDA